MGSAVKRGIAAAVTVVVAAAVNVATGMLTQHWAVAWWAATIVLVLVGVDAQMWLTLAGGTKPADGPATVSPSVQIGRNNTGIVSVAEGATNVQLSAEASGQGQVYQATRDQYINQTVLPEAAVRPVAEVAAPPGLVKVPSHGQVFVGRVEELAGLQSVPAATWSPTPPAPTPPKRPSQRATTWPSPTRRRAIRVGPSHCTNKPSPTPSGCWAPTTPPR